MKLSQEQFENEKNYSATMYIADNLLNQKLITKKEHEKFCELASRKHTPIFG